MVQNPEQPLVLELKASVEGKPLPSEVYKTAPDLVAGLMGGGSGNWGPLGWAVAYRQNPRGIRERWLAFFAASRKLFMGDELLSTTYGLWGHLLPVAAVHEKASREQDEGLATAAFDWLRFYFGAYELCRVPDGTILTVGMRSSPWHAPEQAATWLGWVRALARGEDLGRWEAAGHKWGLGMKQSFIPPTARAVLSSLAAASTAAGLPPFGTMTPLHVLDADSGQRAVWLEANGNGNTPPLMGAVWRDGHVGFLPDVHGDNMTRIRQQFDHATCRRDAEAGALVYDSNLFGHQVLPLPAGGFETVIGGTKSEA